MDKELREENNLCGHFSESLHREIGIWVGSVGFGQVEGSNERFYAADTKPTQWWRCGNKPTWLKQKKLVGRLWLILNIKLRSLNANKPMEVFLF